jgi:hypothetical protein
MPSSSKPIAIRQTIVIHDRLSIPLISLVAQHHFASGHGILSHTEFYSNPGTFIKLPPPAAALWINDGVTSTKLLLLAILDP